jgi:hypothetical protein
MVTPLLLISMFHRPSQAVSSGESLFGKDGFPRKQQPISLFKNCVSVNNFFENCDGCGISASRIEPKTPWVSPTQSEAADDRL